MFLLLFSASADAVVPGHSYIENNYFTHIVEPGDTFYKISRIFNTNISTLKELNPDLDPHRLQIGDKITININLDYHEVELGDTLWEISQMYNYKLDDIIAYNRMTNPDLLLPGEVILFPEKSFIADSGSIKIIKFLDWNRSVYVTGLARVFEATINYALETEAGEVLDEGFMTATAGGPAWGEFNILINDIPEKAHYLAIFSISAKDGTRQFEIKLEL